MRHACPPEEDGLPLVVGEVTEDRGLGFVLAGVVMEIMHLEVGVWVDEVDATVEDGGEKLQTSPPPQPSGRCQCDLTQKVA